MRAHTPRFSDRQPGDVRHCVFPLFGKVHWAPRSLQHHSTVLFGRQIIGSRLLSCAGDVSRLGKKVDPRYFLSIQWYVCVYVCICLCYVLCFALSWLCVTTVELRMLPVLRRGRRARKKQEQGASPESPRCREEQPPPGFLLSSVCRNNKVFLGVCVCFDDDEQWVGVRT